MNFPADRRYTKDHEWVLVNGDLATLGITEFAQGELGELVFVELPSIGKQLEQGKAFCVVESTKAASDVYAPVSGVVTEINQTLSQSPDLINSDPYVAGWITKIKDFQLAEVEKLMSAEEYQKHLGK